MVAQYFGMAILVAFWVSGPSGQNTNGSGNGIKCGDDTLCIACGENPWCYHGKLVEQRDYSRCSNITLYWGSNAVGVEGSCYYENAVATKDCPLCDKITKADIKEACRDDGR